MSSLERAAVLPDVPPIADTVPGFDFTAWTGVLVPANTPPDVARKIHNDIAAVLQRPEIKERYAAQGAYVVSGDAKYFGDLIRREQVLFTKVIKAAKIQVE